MNKEYILRKNEDIQKVYNNKDKKHVTNLFIIYIKKNDINHNRYCISISKKIGKANVRNLYKRRIKDILMKNNLNNSSDYVIIIRKPIIEKEYLEIKQELLNALERRK